MAPGHSHGRVVQRPFQQASVLRRFVLMGGTLTSSLLRWCSLRLVQPAGQCAPSGVRVSGQLVGTGRGCRRGGVGTLLGPEGTNNAPGFLTWVVCFLLVASCVPYQLVSVWPLGVGWVRVFGGAVWGVVVVP